MKILLSPSESKNNPHDNKEIFNAPNHILTDVMWGGFEARKQHIKQYLEILQASNDETLHKVFGMKSIPLASLALSLKLLETPTTQAIRLYSGVAYKALDFESLDSRAKDFILENVLICSNLFGLVRAKDLLPYYHLNQNYKTKHFSIKQLYQSQSSQIDTFLSNEEILDLRAGIYTKAYPLMRPHFILKAPNAHITHQIKLYRGLALRELVLHIDDMDSYIYKQFEFISK